MVKPNHSQLKRSLSHTVKKLYPKDITIDIGSSFDGGGFSDIYRGRWVDPNETAELAIKVFRKNRDIEPEMMKTMTKRLWIEVETWVKAQPHPNILPFLGLYIDQQPLNFPALVSPLRLDGNIEIFLRKSNANRRLLCAGIARGLAHLHDYKVIHGDLKPQNVLINRSEDGVPIPEISDFGRAKIQGLDRFLGSLHTTPRYTAPEVLLYSQPSPENSGFLPSPEGMNQHLTKYSDVFSLGMVILQVVSGVKPYSNCNEFQIALVFSGKGSKEPKLELHQRHCSMDWIWPLLRLCWGFDGPPRERCEASECLQILSDLPDPTETVPFNDMDDLCVTQLFEGNDSGQN